MTSNTTPYLRVTNIDAYINSNRERENNYAIIKGDGSYVYIVNGIEVDGKEFENNNPPVSLQSNKSDKGMRLDGRSNWID